MYGTQYLRALFIHREDVAASIARKTLPSGLAEKEIKLFEIATAEIDNKGFDVVLTVNKVTRHVPLKCSKLGAKRRNIDVNVGLFDKPSPHYS